MVALADRSKCHKEVLHRVDVLVIRLVAPQVSYAVHTPGGVQRKAVAQRAGDVEGRSDRLAPEVPGHDGGHNETEDDNEEKVEPARGASQPLSSTHRRTQNTNIICSSIPNWFIVHVKRSNPSNRRAETDL